MAQNIKEYTAPDAVPRATETGVEAVAAAARRSGMFFNQAAAGVKEVGEQNARMVGSTIKDVGAVAVAAAEHVEISHGAAAFAGLNDALTQQWNDTVKGSDPNDPNVANKFREQTLEPALEKFKAGFLTEGGQKWGERQIDALRNHMFQKTAADMGSLAADAVAVNMKRTGNALSNTAVQDPSSVPHLLDTVDASVGPIVDSSPYLKGAVGAKAKMQLTQDMKQKIVDDGALSAIQKSSDPEATALDWAKRYPEYLNGDKALQLARAARTQNRFNDAQDKAATVAQRQIAKDDFDKASASLIGTLIDPQSPTGLKPTTPDYFKALEDKILKMPGATRSGVEELFKFGVQNGTVKASDPATKMDLQTRLYKGELAPLDIIKAANDGKLSHSDAATYESQRKLVQEHVLKDPVYETAMKAVQARLIDQFGGPDPIGTGNYANFMSSFLPDYIKKKADGSLDQNALDLNDPNSMIRKRMAPYILSANEKTKALAEGQKAPAATPAVDKPPMEGAVKSSKGDWVIQKDGKWFKVVQ